MALKIGSTSPRETHDSREIERLRKGRLITIRKNGDYAALAAAMPAPGEKLDGGRVRTSTLRRLAGGIGLLEYTVRVGGLSVVGAGYSDAVVEIEMAQTERPITALKKYSGYAGEIEMWRSGDAALRSEYKYVDESGNTQSLTGRAIEAAKLILRGIESVLVFHPVLTATRTFDERPGDYGNKVGRRDRPPVSAPGGYDWLKTADRLQQSSDGDTWTRVEQWTGASTELGGWEKTLYGN